MLVSIVISAFNEEKYLPALFQRIEEQTYPHDQMELMLINAMSTDTTKKIMQQYQQVSTLKRVEVIDNPKKNQPSGFNLGVRHAKGDVILKIDAHSTVPSDFVENNVQVIASGETICGGKRPTLIESTDALSTTLHLVEESMFGSSIAAYRKADHSRYVSSIFHGMYKREVFDKCGLMNEQLARTEDNEFHYRLRQHGYRIFYDPKIVSYQYMRPTFSKMMKQKYSNGYWIGLTTHVIPGCLSSYHFVPALFVLALLGTGILYPFVPLLWAILVTAYALVNGLVSIYTWLTHPFRITHLLLPFFIFLVHIAYGVGTWVGLLKGFTWKKTYFAKQ